MTIEVNGQSIEAKEQEMLLPALERAGFKIPTLCHLPELPPSGACRMCVVEVEGKPGLIPSCAYPVAEGMKVWTHSPRVIKARKTVVELLLADHPDDCLYCIRNGHCELQTLAEKLGVRERRYSGGKTPGNLDVSSPALVRDPEKCILCGRCVRVCEEVQGVAAIDFAGRGSGTRVETTFEQGLNVSSCVNCGQCVTACPTGALREQSHMKGVQDALNDPETFVVVQHAPAVSVTLAEEFNMKAGTDVVGQMTTAFRNIGFDRVFSTAFAADLTIMEEASELADRLQNGGALPMMTSCSPGWIKYVEQFQPDFIPNLSSCKSPQQMMGAVIKSYFAQQNGLKPEQIYSVSVMPCTAKKFEAQRLELTQNGQPDVDAVLTTRELARLLRIRGIDLEKQDPGAVDSPLGERSTAGKIFGASGGVMEAAVRTAHYLVTGEEMADLNLQPVRGMKGIKTASLSINGIELNVAVANGLGQAKKILEDIKAGKQEIHFLEVMTCPGGCIGGGGQPYESGEDDIRKRMRELYELDSREKIRTSHGNKSIQKLYNEFLGEPLSHKSHELLHTHYEERTTKT